MENSGEFHRSKFIKNMADGYHYDENGKLRKRCCDDASSVRGAASLYSTAADLNKWLLSLQNSVEVFGFDLFSQMLDQANDGESQTNANEIENVEAIEDETFFGYGLKVTYMPKGIRRVSHSGHEWGYISSMSFYPEQELEVIVLSNRHQLYGNAIDNVANSLSLEIENLVLTSEKRAE